MRRSVELSLVITAHSEGILAHKTILSVERALAKITDTYEIIVHIDNGTPETVEYFQRYATDERFRIVQNNLGDLGESRNAAVKVACGKYVLFLDADDLISENYIAEMLKILQAEKRDVVVGPQYCLTFEDCTGRFALQELPNSGTREENATLLFGVNPWVSSIAGSREMFLQYPYKATGGGFGHEDYALNIELLGEDIPHLSAPGTVHFYRRRPDSLIMRNSTALKTQPYSKLFDYREWQKYSMPADLPKTDTVAKVPVLKKVYAMLRHDSKAVNAVLAPLATCARKLTGKKLVTEDETNLYPDVPSCVLAAWKDQAQIEMQLFPTPNFLKYLVIYDLDKVPFRYLSHYYWQLCQQITHTPDYVFIVPWVVSGGADKVLLNYIKALQEVHPKWKLTVITTRPVENSWEDRLPADVDLIDFGTVAKDLAPELEETLMTRLMVQLNCKKVHIINSLAGYWWVRDHAELAKNNFEIYVSLFCNDLLIESDRDGWWGYADPYLSRIYTTVRKAFTDNQNYIDEMIEQDAFDAEKLQVVYQPVEKVKSIKRPHYTKPRKLKILWASRVALQKNPELVVRIAQKLDPEKFHIDAFGRKDVGCTDFEFPPELETLTYRGEFNGLHSLDLGQYDLMLYTSYSDGLPNVILEAAAAGLPVLASNVGGVSDFVKPGKTGFLVDEIEDENKYIEVLEEIYQKPKVLSQVSDEASKLLAKQHSWKEFCKIIKREF